MVTKHGFPPHDIGDFRTFLQQQWSQHLQELDSTPRLRVDHISRLKAALGEQVVIHHADHQNQNARIFCPQLYFQMCNNTWTDPQLFFKLNVTPEEALTKVQKLAKRWIQTRYKWGIDWGAKLPQGFNVCYTVPICSNSLGSNVETGLATKFGTVLSSRNMESNAYFLSKKDADIELHTLNDDLIGFFNSVPQHKLLKAVEILVGDWHSMYGATTIQVEVNKTNFHQQNITAGKPNRNNFDVSKTHTIHIFDLPDIVKLSFDCCIFQTLGQIFQQHRGTGIGKQISPILSNIQVTLTERIWYSSFQAHLADMQLRHPLLMIRYVDNRFALFPQHLAEKRVLQIFAHKHFYQIPVELEDVGTQELVGFDVEANERTILYRQPDQPWKIRDTTSAGSWTLRLSGLRSRAVLISRYSWPPSDRRRQILQLIDKYVEKGFSRARCKAIL